MTVFIVFDRPCYLTVLARSVPVSLMERLQPTSTLPAVKVGRYGQSDIVVASIGEEVSSLQSISMFVVR